MRSRGKYAALRMARRLFSPGACLPNRYPGPASATRSRIASAAASLAKGTAIAQLLSAREQHQALFHRIKVEDKPGSAKRLSLLRVAGSAAQAIFAAEKETKRK
jgi:hypothetical protein